MINTFRRHLLLGALFLFAAHAPTLAKSPLFAREKKDLALLQCLRINYLHLGFDLYDHDYSQFYKNYANVNSRISVENDLLFIDFIKNKTSEYYKEQISIKNESNKPPPFTVIFGKCMEFYKSKELDQFLQKSIP